MSKFLNVIRTRRSIRRYKPQPIPKEQITEILNLCRYAANAHNAQPFRFVVILNATLKKKLIDAMSKRYKEDLRRDGLPETTIFQIVNTSNSRFLEAPVLILACLTMEDMHHYPDVKRQECEFTMAIQSLANSLQNFLLIAHSKGLGACWYCAPLFCPDIVKSILNLPPHYIPQAFITLGIPNETPPPIHRRPLEDLVLFLE
ncbi:MAG: nitroreductase family protein [Candidatus Helarchaeota archaeon]